MQRCESFDTKVFGGRIELADQLVDNFDQFVASRPRSLVDRMSANRTVTSWCSCAMVYSPRRGTARQRQASSIAITGVFLALR